MKVELINSIDDKVYDNFLLENDQTILYQSFKYIKFIKELTGSESSFFILKNNDQLLAIMPFLIKESKYGKVLNSLPFYGSNGAVIAKDNNLEYKLEILKFYKDYIFQNKFLSSTIIVSPFEKHQIEYDQFLNPNYSDARIGQLTPLPDSQEKLFEALHYKTRNSIRKGEKSNILINFSEGEKYFDFLFETHKENITSIGGTFKDKKVFDLFKSTFEYGKDYKIFVGTIDGKPVSALLNFYFNNTVEYYTPVTVKEYRDLQPLSAIIWFAMKDAIKNNFSWWNWGGTWHTQKGVYDFKKRWGTKDLHYRYYINTYNDSILDIPKAEIIKEFQYFYTVPFNILKT